jgi:putative FmdB family regulatory protein
MMPIYEYECEKCTCRFELKRRFDEDAGNPCCPLCQCKVRQLFSPPVILFKGSGFYVTDNRNDHNWQSAEGKANKVEGGKKKESKAEKVKGGSKGEGKADKDQSGKKSASK